MPDEYLFKRGDSVDCRLPLFVDGAKVKMRARRFRRGTGHTNYYLLANKDGEEEFVSEEFINHQ